MFGILNFVVIGLFIGMLFLNVYFRVKVMKVYKKLVQNRVDFELKHILNPSKMESDILPRYPKHKSDILEFTTHMRQSIKIALLLIGLITAFGLVSVAIK